MTRYFLFILLLGCLYSCTPEIEAIHFGEDQCFYCKMTIVDQRYGAELLTTKGKIYKYDAVECMINHVNDATHFTNEDIHSQHVVCFDKPKELLEVSQAKIFHAKSLPSPMGMYLSLFQTESALNETAKAHEGKEMSYEECKIYVLNSKAWE